MVRIKLNLKLLEPHRYVSSHLSLCRAAIVFGIVILTASRYRRKTLDQNTLIWIGWVAVFAVSLNLAKNSVALLPSWAYYVGISMMLAGIAVWQWAIAVLGRYFSNIIGAQKEQKVVQNGSTA